MSGMISPHHGDPLSQLQPTFGIIIIVPQDSHILHLWVPTTLIKLNINLWYPFY